MNNEIGSNFLKIAAKEYMHKGTTYASGVLDGIMGGLVGAPSVGLPGVMAGKLGSVAYKSRERGFASKNPKWKIKTLYPSTSNIDKSISNAYTDLGCAQRFQLQRMIPCKEEYLCWSAGLLP